MALNYFLMYIGIFLACAVGLFMVSKNFTEGMSVNPQKPALQGSLSAVLASGAAFITTLFEKHLFTIFWIFTAVFILFGIIHVLYFHKKYFSGENIDKGKTKLGEVMYMLALLFFIVVVFASLERFLGDKRFLFLPMLTSMLGFFTPLLIYYTFETAYNIPASIFPNWQYPVNDPIDLPDERPNEKLLVIAFEICKKNTDKARTNFRAKGPEGMKLGDLFYHFINDYNDMQSETPIEYAEGNTNVYVWGFRLKPKWYQSERVLDPELTVRENLIRENAVIICDRI